LPKRTSIYRELHQNPVEHLAIGQRLGQGIYGVAGVVAVDAPLAAAARFSQIG
jgi:hypothetical protein